MTDDDPASCASVCIWMILYYESILANTFNQFVILLKTDKIRTSFTFQAPKYGMVGFDLFQSDPLSPEAVFIRANLGSGLTSCDQTRLLYTALETVPCKKMTPCTVHEDDYPAGCVFRCKCDKTDCKLSSGITDDNIAPSICHLVILWHFEIMTKFGKNWKSLSSE